MANEDAQHFNKYLEDFVHQVQLHGEYAILTESGLWELLAPAGAAAYITSRTQTIQPNSSDGGNNFRAPAWPVALSTTT
jgi:hypothetical protein